MRLQRVARMHSAFEGCGEAHLRCVGVLKAEDALEALCLARSFRLRSSVSWRCERQAARLTWRPAGKNGKRLAKVKAARWLHSLEAGEQMVGLDKKRRKKACRRTDAGSADMARSRAV
eukprot:2713602-Pleurochrysis_carterae.AAC.6